MPYFYKNMSNKWCVTEKEGRFITKEQSQLNFMHICSLLKVSRKCKDFELGSQLLHCRVYRPKDHCRYLWIFSFSLARFPSGKEARWPPHLPSFLSKTSSLLSSLCCLWTGRMCECVSGYLEQCQGQQIAQTHPHTLGLTQDVGAEHKNCSFFRESSKYSKLSVSVWYVRMFHISSQSAVAAAAPEFVPFGLCQFPWFALYPCVKLVFNALGATYFIYVRSLAYWFVVSFNWFEQTIKNIFAGFQWWWSALWMNSTLCWRCWTRRRLVHILLTRWLPYATSWTLFSCQVLNKASNFDVFHIILTYNNPIGTSFKYV